ncbi:nuclear transport factor 2 family protein [Companilactobacillus baiquanensis]|uniref:Nuclear transport factor 2 family protein n=1 Tax=Companilactobacillus baiquanensis TaxID=2486005 RepID=A0ABW1USJ0_9LACO|nr:nuclear transport factor 2 family protein [Companilactobacillus baiquanensis]
MDQNNLPEAINNFIKYTNDGDSEKFISIFSKDATLNDWGNIYHQPKEIAIWNKTDNIGKKSHFELVDAKETGIDTWVINLKVSGNGFNGTSPFEIVLEKDLIKSLQILPD